MNRPNIHEVTAWRVLVELGAREAEIGGYATLDVRTCRLRSVRNKTLFASAFLDVVGRSGTMRRHVDRNGRPVFVVSPFPAGTSLREILRPEPPPAPTPAPASTPRPPPG